MGLLGAQAHRKGYNKYKNICQTGPTWGPKPVEKLAEHTEMCTKLGQLRGPKSIEKLAENQEMYTKLKQLGAPIPSKRLPQTYPKCTPKLVQIDSPFAAEIPPKAARKPLGCQKGKCSQNVPKIQKPSSHFVLPWQTNRLQK